MVPSLHVEDDPEYDFLEASLTARHDGFFRALHGKTIKTIDLKAGDPIKIKLSR
ncbi:MAG: hypothetical protein KAU94_11660 [Verrucomicrobia bacterium]|nr:hypothetical protein [Verrucomicrobiota bacterium]